MKREDSERAKSNQKLDERFGFYLRNMRIDPGICEFIKTYVRKVLLYLRIEFTEECV
ncbi:hypothetical protein LEP1GSC194_1166 [Leptospira alstonii serovar Sichuan str. 79601]|uniref:Uncharacterized protein n=1 Tax=Leptospira alstonii serovar Sichuan str. 79601 TaxID=1218565 RepID=M6CW85_9LEPT|nr:hypothetical protein LEP1GSC194_1166 [Leptospira alstonii serovar Sichuan str. 79601]